MLSWVETVVARRAWVVWVGVGLLWLVTHPYAGILWDAQYYTVQALHALTPNRYADDLFFAYGSQDQFSLFSRLYAPLIQVWGLAHANLLLTLVGQGLWLGGLIYLARGWLAREDQFLALAGVILLPGSASLLFHYAEPILTPRLYAEALTLWAMGDVWRARWVRSWLLLTLGLVLHPLMVIPGFALWFLWGPGQHRSGWLGLLGVMALGYGLALGGIQPFARIFQTFDPQWWAIVYQRTTYAWIGQWGIAEWLPVLHVVMLGFWVAQDMTLKQRRLLWSSLGVGVGGIAISALGGDGLKNVLILDAQLWRGIWLANVLIHLGVAQRFQRMWVGSGDRHHARFWWSSVIFMALLSGLHGGFFLLAMPLTAMAYLIDWWEQRQRGIPQRWVTIVEVIVGLWGGELLMLFAASLWRDESMMLRWENGFLPELVLVMAILTWVLWAREKSLPYWQVVVGGFLLGVLGMMHWDQRDPWVRYIDETKEAPAELTALLPAQRAIYWEGDLTVPWFLLRRSSYFSCSQGTGSLFSRGTAVHYQREYESFRTLNTIEFLPGTYCSPAPGPLSYPPVASQVLAVCRANPHLGALVLLHPVVGMAQKTWQAPTIFRYDLSLGQRRRRIETRTFYVVNCPA